MNGVSIQTLVALAVASAVFVAACVLLAACVVRDVQRGRRVLRTVRKGGAA
jgi:hypothetical protein